jgi:transposase
MPLQIVKLANDALTQVRQRLTQETKGRRGRSSDPVWANRHLLMCGAITLSARAWDRLQNLFAVDDPTGRLESARHVKEQVRSLLRAGSLVTAATTAKVEVNNTTIKTSNAGVRGFLNQSNIDHVFC